MGQPRVSPSPVPADSWAPELTDPFRRLLPTICLICLMVHAAFLALFLITGVPAMVIVNAVSILWYAGVWALVRKGRTKLIVEFALLAAEIVAHAVLATAILGWDSGFHYYVLLLVPFTALAPLRPAWLKTAAVASAGLAYLGLDLWLRAEPTSQYLSDHSPPYVHFFNVSSALLVLAVLAGRYCLLIAQMQAALQALASTDPLTQLPNRNSLVQTIAVQEARASRGHPLSFIMCDIDHFKRINDHGGHSAGDAVLQTVTRSMAAGVRGTDVLGRWGGEEFLVVLPDADTVQAAAVAERIRELVAGLPAPTGDGPSQVTVTIGVATMNRGESAAAAIARADNALYEGKRQGRNRVAIASSPTLHADTTSGTG